MPWWVSITPYPFNSIATLFQDAQSGVLFLFSVLVLSVYIVALGFRPVAIGNGKRRRIFCDGFHKFDSLHLIYHKHQNHRKRVRRSIQCLLEHKVFCSCRGPYTDATVCCRTKGRIECASYSLTSYPNREWTTTSFFCPS